MGIRVLRHRLWLEVGKQFQAKMKEEQIKQKAIIEIIKIKIERVEKA